MDLPTLGYKLVLSVFLARLFGFYILIMITAMIVRKDHFKQFISDFLENSAVVMLTAVFTIIFGLVLVLLHNAWVPNWRVVVTIICWWTLAKGCILLFFPTPFTEKTRALLESPAPLYVTIAIDLSVAIFLIYHTL